MTQTLTLPQVNLATPKIDTAGLPSGYLTEREMSALVELVRTSGVESVVEIGCNNGRTAEMLLRNCPGLVDYLGVDVTPGYSFACDVQAQEVPGHPGQYAQHREQFALWLSARGSFDLDASKISDMLGAGPVAFFIDGDHGAAAVEHDTKLARDLLALTVQRTGVGGGIIIWHDYHDMETVDVRRVLEAQYAEGRKIQHVADTWLAFEYV